MRINERIIVAQGLFSSESMTTSSESPEDDSSLIRDSLPPAAAFPIGDCVYRGEGNANVVIALPQERKVIRFRKSLPEEVSPDGGKLRVEREVEFVSSVVSCFLGSYAQIPEILRCDMKDIARLSEAIRALRPGNYREPPSLYETTTKATVQTATKQSLSNPGTPIQQQKAAVKRVNKRVNKNGRASDTRVR